MNPDSDTSWLGTLLRLLLCGIPQAPGKKGKRRALGWLTDVDDVALLVQHDVAIVPVLDLQQEQQEAVGGHAADEVVARLCRESQCL